MYWFVYSVAFSYDTCVINYFNLLITLRRLINSYLIYYTFYLPNNCWKILVHIFFEVGKSLKLFGNIFVEASKPDIMCYYVKMFT